MRSVAAPVRLVSGWDNDTDLQARFQAQRMPHVPNRRKPNAETDERRRFGSPRGRSRIHMERSPTHWSGEGDPGSAGRALQEQW